MPMVEKCLTSEKATERRAGYLAMAVVVEGCADYVMSKWVQGPANNQTQTIIYVICLHSSSLSSFNHLSSLSSFKSKLKTHL